MRVRAEIARDLDKTVGVGAVFRTDDEEEISFRSYLLDRDLAVLGGVANILRGRTFDVGEFLLQRGDDVFGFVEAERGLREIRDAIGIGHGERLDLLRASDNLRDKGSLAEGSDNFVVVMVADEDERITFLGELDGFDVNFGDQRASGIDHAQAAALAVLADFGRDAVGAVDDALAVRHFVFAIDEDGALAAEFVNHKAVVARSLCGRRSKKADPKASRAMRGTTSMARTTPAQNPRGFSNSKVFPWLFGNIRLLLV